jgi:hypothetical protein
VILLLAACGADPIEVREVPPAPVPTTETASRSTPDRLLDLGRHDYSTGFQCCQSQDASTP